MAGYSSDIHIDQFLTSLSLSYSNDTLVGDTVFPPMPVNALSDTYVIYGQEAFKVYDDVRRPGADAAEIRQSLSRGMFLAQEHALKELVPDADKRHADAPLDAEMDATLFLTETVRNQREFFQLGIAGDATQITQNVALSGTTLWSDYTNSTPLTNIRTGRAAVRSGVHRPANRMLVSYDAAVTLADHPSIKDLIKYTDPNNISEDGLPTTIRGLTVDVAVSDKDTSGIGTASPTFVPAFGKACLIYYRNPNPGLRSLTLGVTLEAPDQTTMARGFNTRKWFDDAKKGTWVETADTYAVKILAPLAGYLISPVVA